MINLAKILQHNVLGKLASHAVFFFINIIIVRILGAEGSGVYFNELYILNFIALLCSIGIDFSIISFLAQQPELLGAIRKKMMMVSLVFFVALIAIVFLINVFSANNYFTQPAWVLLLVCGGNFLLILYQGLLSALKKFNLQNGVLIITNTLFLCYLLLLYNGKLHPAGLKAVANGYAILFIVQGIIMMLLSAKPAATVSSVNIPWKRFLKPGIYMMLASLIYFCFLRIDNFFVEKYCDNKALSNYIQCGKIGQYFIYFSSIISSTLLPFIAKETVGASYKEWLGMIRPYFLLISLAAVGVISTGNFLFPFMFGPDFEEMYFIMLILLPGFVALGLLTLINSVYIGKGNLRPILIGDIAGLLLVFVFDLLLVPSFGVYAAAAISSVSYILVFGYLAMGFKKQFSLNSSQTGIYKL